MTAANLWQDTPQACSLPRPLLAVGITLCVPSAPGVCVQLGPEGHIQGAGEIWGAVAALTSAPLVPICFPSILGTPFCLLEHCAGHIHRAVSLPAVPPCQRRAWYGAMANALARIHSLDLRAAKLQDLGEHGESSLCILSSPVGQHFKG